MLASMKVVILIRSMIVVSLCVTDGYDMTRLHLSTCVKPCNAMPCDDMSWHFPASHIMTCHDGGKPNKNSFYETAER